MSDWRHLGNDTCPNPDCKGDYRSRARLRIDKDFRRFILMAFMKLVRTVPDGDALSYQCPHCGTIRPFTVHEVLGEELDTEIGGLDRL